jgi:cytochrome oxidase Cu insertion factor (SCO1/SenC/PrrC family)
VVIRLLIALVVLMTGAMGGAGAAGRFIPLLQPGDAVPPIPLVAQDGHRFALSDLRGNALAVSFIYTRCRDPRMCPLVSAKFARAQSTIGAAPIRLVVLTLDTSFDTPAVLTRYGRVFGQDPRRWTLATGSAADLDEMAGRFGIASEVTVPGTIVHTEAAVIIGPDGRLARIVYGNDWSAAELVEFARAALPAASNDPLLGLRAFLATVAERCGAGGLAVGGPAVLGILALALAISGAAFWRAFRSG